ncbi:MAG TPA: hypothetical protein VIW92_13465, partial [Thermoanaerobaculia bacterium]
MPEPEIDPREDRVLVLTPTGRDALLVCKLLASVDVCCHPCESPAEVFQELAAGAGALIVADEALHPEVVEGLLKTLA